MNWWKLASESSPPFDMSVGFHEIRIGHCTLLYEVFEDRQASLYSVRVPQRFRRKGEAKAALAAFTKALDQSGLRSKLLASPLDKKTRTHKLVGLYGQFGFQPNGRSGNPVGDPELERPSAGNPPHFFE